MQHRTPNRLPLLFLLVLVAAALAGCNRPTMPTEPGVQSSSTNTSSMEQQDTSGVIPPVEENRVDAPRWLPGYHWEYVNDFGNWHNKTVVAAETYNGRSTYHVRTNYSVPDEDRIIYEDCWIDQEALGFLRCTYSDGFQVQTTTPAAQVFPMQSRTYETTVSGTGGYNYKTSFSYEVGQSEEAIVPLGNGSCIHVVTREVPGNMSIQLACYSFAVQNYLFYDQEPNEDRENDIYRLASWGRTAKGA